MTKKCFDNFFKQLSLRHKGAIIRNKIDFFKYWIFAAKRKSYTFDTGYTFDAGRPYWGGIRQLLIEKAIKKVP